MIARVLRSWQELDELSHEWNQLLERSAFPSIFLTWEWIQAWRVSIESAVTPYVVTVRAEDGRLVGLAPLYGASFRLLGLVRYRALRFMGDVATGSEYPDWIVDPEIESEVIAAISAELAEKTKDWDLIWLPRVSGWTGAKSRVEESARQIGLLTADRVCPFSAAELPSEISEFEAGFSSRRRQQMRRSYRRIAKLDGIEFVRCEDPDRLPDFLDALFDLHQLRWESVGKDGCFRRKPSEERFYREFSSAVFRNRWVSIYGLLEHGVFRAVQFGYVYNGCFLQLQEGYDPEFQQGAGNALRYHVISDCIAAGIKEYDFLGGESEHKRRWSAAARTGYDILIGNRSLKTRLWFAAGCWPSGRFVDQSEIGGG